MLKKIFNSRAFNFVFIFAYVFIMLIWFMTYIFIGEDVELNTMHTYFIFNGFSIAFCFIIFLFLKFSHCDKSKLLVVLFEATLILLLVAGFLGSKGVIVPDRNLVYTRGIVLILHLFIVSYGICKVINFIRV
ncbi:hypothetical protein Y919_12125 [Caloranaerobacter azorensis H53214]|uniref:Uncharacterized protein n=1 Tax=Caloranaerobacter azorensis H53214 TaxID=1156417 RepID=A0A096DJG1_9FIRM|nr:hypothetical protein [Caloranaerobacter azorensis]KGG79426.1 hypothetical protein Y919_12125 [Caloranaerobacter azorensis H53214]